MAVHYAPAREDVKEKSGLVLKMEQAGRCQPSLSH